MLGHKLWQMFREHFDTWVTVRSNYEDYAIYDLFDQKRTLGGVDVLNIDSIIRACALVKPTVVINCIGIIKQLPTAKDPILSLIINSLFPHRLANMCQAAGVRLIHISTDCVFSGRKGMYTEEDVSDAEDLYGRTKYLGEIDVPGCLTLRTPIIGRELRTTNGLVEWFLSNQGGKVYGYTGAIYSGFTTLALAQIISNIIEHHPNLTGVYQVSSKPISKYELLCLLREAFKIKVDIEPYSIVNINLSLDSSRFRKATGFLPPGWADMIHKMANDSTLYEMWRRKHEI